MDATLGMINTTRISPSPGWQ